MTIFGTETNSQAVHCGSLKEEANYEPGSAGTTVDVGCEEEGKDKLHLLFDTIFLDKQ